MSQEDEIIEVRLPVHSTAPGKPLALYDSLYSPVPRLARRLLARSRKLKAVVVEYSYRGGTTPPDISLPITFYGEVDDTPRALSLFDLPSPARDAFSQDIASYDVDHTPNPLMSLAPKLLHEGQTHCRIMATFTRDIAFFTNSDLQRGVEDFNEGELGYRGAAAAMIAGEAWLENPGPASSHEQVQRFQSIAPSLRMMEFIFKDLTGTNISYIPTPGTQT